MHIKLTDMESIISSGSVCRPTPWILRRRPPGLGLNVFYPFLTFSQPVSWAEILCLVRPGQMMSCVPVSRIDVPLWSDDPCPVDSCLNLLRVLDSRNGVIGMSTSPHLRTWLINNNLCGQQFSQWRFTTAFDAYTGHIQCFMQHNFLTYFLKL